MVTAPGRVENCTALRLEMPHDIAIRVEDARDRSVGFSQPLLTTRLPQQALRRECGRGGMILVRKDRQVGEVGCAHGVQTREFPSVPIPKFASLCGTLRVRTSESKEH